MYCVFKLFAYCNLTSSTIITQCHKAIKLAIGSFKGKEQADKKSFEVSSLASHQCCRETSSAASISHLGSDIYNSATEQ